MATDRARASTATPRPSQREQAAAEARTRILAAAADCIVRDGLAQVRMASIARTAGVSAGLLHYHFDTKELLFGEVLRYSHEVSAELNQQALSQAGDGPAERLSSFLDRCLPSDDQRADEWLLWQELALLCIRDPHLAKVGSDRHRARRRRLRRLRHRPRPARGRGDGRRAHRRARGARPRAGPQPRDRPGARRHRDDRRDPGRPRRATPPAGRVRRRGRHMSRADVVVVGAGLAGLSAARDLEAG
jgi:AcrR family transcriptional regulator